MARGGRGLANARRRLEELEAEPASDDVETSPVEPDAFDFDAAEFAPDADAEEADAEGVEPSRRDAKVRRALLVTLAALVVLAVGFGAGIWVGSPKYPGDNSADAGFARDMMIHHAQAVEMASQEFRSTSDDALKTLAVDITLTQQAQTGIMRTWLDTWGLSPTSSKGPMSWMPDGGKALLVDGRMPGMATDAELAKLRADKGKAQDILFCQLMIKHHLGGIHMIDAVLPLSHNPQVKQLADQMKASQQSDILALQDIENGLTGTK